MGGSSAKRQADSEAAMYRAQAAARLAKAEFDADAANRKYRRGKGQVESRGAASGISLESFYDVMNDDAMESALERAAIRWSAQSEANMLEYQASSATRRGKDAQTASYFNAAGSAVSAFTPMIRSSYSGSGSTGATKMSAGISLDDNGPAYSYPGSLK